MSLDSVTSDGLFPPPARHPDAYQCWQGCGDGWVLPERLDPTSSTGAWIDGSAVCTDCLSDLTTCDQCDERMVDMYDAINGDTVCGDCTRGRCDDCDHYATGCDDLTAVRWCHEVCDSCRDSNYSYCHECDEYRSADEDCYDCSRYDSDLIQNWDYRPTPNFHGDGRLYMGLELEISSADNDCARLANEALGSLGYLKEDSSVSDGFEIVTHPMTHEYAREQFPWGLLHELRQQGASNYDAGLHVHVNRTAFDCPSHVYRWMKLIYRNADQVTDIARRKHSSWAKFSSTARAHVKGAAKGDRCGFDRYSAINVQNYHTFEIRVFASSLRKQEVLAALDLVAASVEYTRTLSVGVIVAGGWTWDAFTMWVSERPEYAALAAEMSALCAY